MKLINLFFGEHPFRNDDLIHMQNGYTEAFEELNKMLQSFGSLTVPNFILRGCDITIGATTDVTEGSIVIDGEILLVEAHSIANAAGTLIWTVQETFTSINPRSYGDGGNNNVNSVRVGRLAYDVSPPANSLIGDGISSVELIQKASFNLGDMKMTSDTLANYDGTGLGIGRERRGWALANGQNGTLDLRGKFIVGHDDTDVDYNAVGKTGGEKEHTLIPVEMPSHNHDVSIVNNPTNISIDPFGINESQVQDPAPSNFLAAGTDAGNVIIDLTHNHVPNDPGHGHAVNETTNGDDQPHENRPPFFALLYLQKI